MSKIKTFFTSRWGEDGVIMEADWSQLEVIVLAHLTKDPQLIKDITDDVDLHTVRAAELYGIPEGDVTKEQRKLAKGLSFQLQYGAGATSMAAKWGVPIELTQKFITNYYDRYPLVKEWQEENIKRVEREGKPIPEHSARGIPIRQSTLSSETGRRYTFKEGDALEYLRVRKKKLTSFKPTEIKNYPVQGCATGDIVPMMLGRVYRELVAQGWTDDAKLICTVHDSFVLDIRKEMVYTIGIKVKELMEAAPYFYEANFGVKFSLPLKVSVTYGPDWSEQTEEI